MKLAVMSGAVKNAGDFLITERAKALLQMIYPHAQLMDFVRKRPLDENQLKAVNSCDMMVFAGGPCYQESLYPQSIALTENLSDLTPPMFMLGAGWHGAIATDAEVAAYRFSDNTISLLKRIQNDTHLLGCRDYYSVQVLCTNGFNARMTGCPAWYDLEQISKRLSFPREIRTIAVSDPADVIHFGEQSLEIVKMLKKKFPQAKIMYLFHRGALKDAEEGTLYARKLKFLQGELQKLQVEIHDISNGHKGFGLYDDSDLHIGYRVHAHIYNLSRRKCSVLIEEDARGAGVNQALGLWGIKAYSRKRGRSTPFLGKVESKLWDYTRVNLHCADEAETYRDYLLSTQGVIVDCAFSLMERYLEEMLAHIRSMENYLK